VRLKDSQKCEKQKEHKKEEVNDVFKLCHCFSQVSYDIVLLDDKFH